MAKGKLRIYGCGGAGINLSSRYENSTIEPGVAQTAPVYVDTSRSNLVKANVDQSANSYILDGMDGSGKVRRENYAEISKSVKQLLQKYPTQDLNVVVFSASGGSGSVAGPLIVGELLERKLPTVAVVIGSHEAAITAQNTVNTLKSLEAIAKKTNLPVVMHYEVNSPGVKRSDIDEACHRVIGGLAYLASGENGELDTRDLLNFLQFSRVTTVEPGLATLEFYVKGEDASQVENPIATASLYRDPDERDLTSVPEYQTEGYPTEQVEILKSTPGIHYVIANNEISVIYKHAANVLDGIQERHASRIKHDSFLTNKDDVTTDGLVL
jgi:hypothetical protein